jgi:acyl-CoA thioester hydrolase
VTRARDVCDNGGMERAYQVRVAFADTDAMGVAWHGAYLRWFEQARTELLRGTAVPYAALVARGFHLPVIEACVRYRRAVRYDDLLAVHAVPGRPRGLRLRIGYRVERGAELVAEGHTEHAFVDAAGRPARPPREMLAVFDRIAGGPGGEAGAP